jgi:hypothetical protein
MPEVADAVYMILNLMDLTPDINAIVYGWRDDFTKWTRSPVPRAGFHE